MLKAHNHFLVVSLLGPHHPDLLAELALCAKQTNSNIIKSKLTNIGCEVTGFIYFSGCWGTIAKLEVSLKKLADKFNIAISYSRTTPKEPIPVIPYKIQVLTPEKTGVVHELIQFFWEKGHITESLECDTLNSHLMYQPMNRISLKIHLSKNQSLTSIRDSFMTYCDEKNLDAYFECDYLSN